jgi:hypothetical protein
MELVRLPEEQLLSPLLAAPAAPPWRLAASSPALPTEVPRDEIVRSDRRLSPDAGRAEEEREPTEVCDEASISLFGSRFSMLPST